MTGTFTIVSSNHCERSESLYNSSYRSDTVYWYFSEQAKNSKSYSYLQKEWQNILVIWLDYRPISILPVESTIVENVMHNQMMDCFTSNELFSSEQYGFRLNRSTELAALELMDKNIDSINQNLSPVNIYVDLSKAFDYLDLAILLSKLKYCRIHDNAI